MLKAVADNESVITLPFEVSEKLSALLNEQRAGLDQVDPKRPGRQRYEEARGRNCFASVAKGARERVLVPGRIFIPGTEISIRNGTLRVSALKLSIPEIPQTVQRIKGVEFVQEGGRWLGQIEVVEEFAVLAESD